MDLPSRLFSDIHVVCLLRSAADEPFFEFRLSVIRPPTTHVAANAKVDTLNK